MRILTIAGSLRRDSFNRKLLQQARELMPAVVESVDWDDLGSVPAFNEDDEDAPDAAVRALRAAIAAVDAVLIATPEYNASIPGQLKNALDWASRPFPDSVLRGKPVLVIGASPSPAGGVRGQADTRKVLRAAGARVLDGELAVADAYRRFDDAGRLVDPELRDRLDGLMHELAANGRAEVVSA
ncbi:MAG TPA: NAD(P)H-dependent oxidoreductase [Cryptosporangiaceae bacterium]|nr:NAD(P)H-dependent oxidoreductase [Cryptosporangiaceae bacterium]